MSAEFGIFIFAMACAAIGFVATPLFRHEQRIGSAGIATALPLFAVALYLVVGSPRAADLESLSDAPIKLATGASSPKKKSAGSVASMVDGLAERLKNNPDDGKSWLLLARSYQHLNRIPEAQAAYQHAAMLGEYDEGLASMASSAVAAAEPAIGVSGRVELSSQSAARVLPTDVVFVFARAPGGPPMPVAVLQRPVSDLPFDFHLNDSHSMSAAKLSDYERVVVSARVTRAGDAKNALQGLEARSGELAVADHRPVLLTIKPQEKQ